MLRVDELTAARRAAKLWRSVAILSWVAVLAVGGWAVYAQHQDAQQQRQADRAVACGQRFDIKSDEFWDCMAGR